MGFEKDVSKILTSIKEKKRDYNHENPNMQPLGTGTAPGEELLYQSVLLSATLSSDVKRLASIALINPVTVDVSVNTGGATNKVSRTNRCPLDHCHRFNPNYRTECV